MSSVSSVSSIPTTSSASSSSASLDKQKSDLENQISAEQSSKDDAATQATKIAALQGQVDQIDAEINAQSKASSKPDDSSQKSENKLNLNSKQPNPDPDKILDTSI
jgi:hypothetical protein